MRALKANIQTAATKVTDIGYIFSGGSGCFNPANLLKDLGKKTGEIEVIRVNPSKNNSTESQNLLAISQITPTINSNFSPTAKAQPPKRV